MPRVECMRCNKALESSDMCRPPYEGTVFEGTAWAVLCVACHKGWRQGPYEKLAEKLGALVASKNRQYGNAVTKSAQILDILYPDGVKPFQFADMLLTVRVLDKLSRISQRGTDGKDLGGESPWMDLGGYSLLGWKKDEAEK